MKKISSKIFIVIVSCSCLVILVLGGVVIYCSTSFIRKDSEEIITLMARQYANKFSSRLNVIEEKVKEMKDHLKDTIDYKALKSDPNYLARYEVVLTDYMKNFAVKRTESISAWCYFNPSLSASPHDVYFVDGDGDGIPNRQNYIPFSYYDNTPLPDDDKEWWYGPIRSKGTFWTNPYEWTLKDNTVIKVVSCAIPVFIGEELVAVVGVYYSFDDILNEIKDIKVYQSGNAFLLNEDLGVIIHPSLMAGTRFTSDNFMTAQDGRFKEVSEQMKNSDYGVAGFIDSSGSRNLLAFAKLSNGWVMGIDPVPSEMYANVNILIVVLIVAAAVCVIIAVCVAGLMGRYIAKPLQQVAIGAQRIGEGDLTVSVKVDTKDEIKIVADSINDMVRGIKRLNSDLERMAYVDELTGGNNLNRFKKLTEIQLARYNSNEHTGGSLYLIRVDIDNFKLINDMFGYDHGDQILCDMSDIIKGCISKTDVYGRMSNDDFLVLLDRDSDEEALKVGRRFREEFMRTHKKYEEGYLINFTTGIYKIPFGEIDMDKIIDRATMAHITAKQMGGDRKFSFYTDKIRDDAVREKSMEDCMSKALADNEFVVYLQPKFDLKSGSLKGAEALVRWIRDGKVVPPGAFIPLFEKNGFVSQIDMYMLEQVCRLQKDWINQGLSIVPISVNQSKLLLFGSDYISKVTQVISRYGVPTKFIELEILETLIHDNIDALIKILDSLKEQGFLISIDDFGSGYSSLNMLKDIKADVLKIDRAFLSRSEDTDRGEIVLSSVVRLARELNMSVVAEGVETEKQAAMLRSINCDTAQGYLYAKPMEVESFYKILLDYNKG